MRASVLTGVKTLSIEQVPTPPIASDEVLVEVAAVGVAGSDTHYYRHGRIGDFVVTGPLILGHELSGRIVAVGKGAADQDRGSGWRSSRRRTAAGAGNAAPATTARPNTESYATPPIDGAFAQYCVIRTEFAHKVPDSISEEAAALLEPLSATTMRRQASPRVEHPGSPGGTGRDHLRPGRTAFGAAEIIITDLVPERRERALRYGATRVLDPRETDIATAGSTSTLVDASGSPQAVLSGIKAVRPAGTAVLVGLGHQR